MFLRSVISLHRKMPPPSESIVVLEPERIIELKIHRNINNTNRKTVNRFLACCVYWVLYTIWKVILCIDNLMKSSKKKKRKLHSPYSKGFFYFKLQVLQGLLEFITSSQLECQKQLTVASKVFIFFNGNSV